MAKKPSTKKPIYDVNWYDDKYQSIVVFRNWMLLITLLSIVGIFLMTMASYYFVPLKSVSPFVIQIDEKSGVTEVVDSRDAREYTSNEMLIKHFAHKYIMARESYNWRNLDNNRNLVRVMSAHDVFRAYDSLINDKDTGYRYIFSTQTSREVALVSSQLRTNRTTGEVTIDARYAVNEISEQRRPASYTIAVQMICKFDPAFQLNDDERLINPLGFVVIYYSSTKERYTDNKTQ